jgi:hypothetical protein
MRGGLGVARFFAGEFFVFVAMAALLVFFQRGKRLASLAKRPYRVNEAASVQFIDAERFSCAHRESGDDGPSVNDEVSWSVVRDPRIALRSSGVSATRARSP